MTIVIDNIFDAIATSAEDAADLKLRNSLIDLVNVRLKDMKLTGKKAQHRLELSDEEWSYFKQGGISFFTPGKLAHMLTLLGQTVSLGAKAAA